MYFIRDDGKHFFDVKRIMTVFSYDNNNEYKHLVRLCHNENNNPILTDKELERLIKLLQKNNLFISYDIK